MNGDLQDGRITGKPAFDKVQSIPPLVLLKKPLPANVPTYISVGVNGLKAMVRTLRFVRPEFARF